MSAALASVVDESGLVGEFFAPASTDMIDGLVGQYQRDRRLVAEVAAFAAGEACTSTLIYFLEGNKTEDRGRALLSGAAAQLFQEAGAVAALNSHYWAKAMALTDVYDAMPQARRNEWSESIRSHKTPDFEEETVRSTLLSLLNSRARFLAERVDGIFRALSGEHVTNSPAAFGKRMIIAHLLSSYGTINHDRVGYISDLRCVVAKFMGRDEPKWNATSSVLEYARTWKRGQWVTLDGGALRLRAYKCGTAHLEVHPDMAWRLNSVLANLYPTAIPAKFRTAPNRKAKSFQMMGRPLPFAAIDALERLKHAVRMEKDDGPSAWRNNGVRRVQIANALQVDWAFVSNEARTEAERVLVYLGGVRVDAGADDTGRWSSYFQFDYWPMDAVLEVIASGCVPDQKAHQYYPTPEAVAAEAVRLAEIEPHHSCLEPSAGTGGLSDLMPKDRTTCVEISPLHCKVLEAKGYQTERSDFLALHAGVRQFDRIVMNPPFSDGRWQAHVKHAAAMLKPGGRLVAVVPASARNRAVLPGMSVEWHGPFDNQFAGTSVSVAILVATPKQ